MRRASARNKHGLDPIHSLRCGALALAAVLLAGLGLHDRAWSQEATESHPVDKALEMLDLKTNAGQPADFVRSSRPKEPQGFMSVGTQHPDRTIKLKSPAELKAAVAELDAARSQQDKIAGRKPPEAVAKPQVKPAKAVSAKKGPATQN